jgi:S-adenosylmethionine:tRNA ribosyltransferase-isomerase
MGRRAIVPAPLPAWRHPDSVAFLRIEAFHYELPPELIAQRPSEDRELARLMRVPIGGGAPEHRRMSELPELIPDTALVVVNDTRVIPARLLGRKRDTGGRVEVLLVRRLATREIEVARGIVREAQVWQAIGKASKPLKVGADIEVIPRDTEAGPAALLVRILGRGDDDGLLEVALWTPAGAQVDAALRECGHVPLPPYIAREDAPEDIDRYQTVYARHEGAIAAPTAGLHLTKSMLDRMAVRGCELASVTLHVGLGTFQSVQVDDLDRHPMHAERYAVTQSTVDAIERARARRAPVVAIGTTTARALESAADPRRPGRVRASNGDTRLLIQPGYRWRIVDGLLTNFHLPRSTLLALVGAFAGLERVLDAYRLAIRERYRFFSYGDAMLLWRDV